MATHTEAGLKSPDVLESTNHLSRLIARLTQGQGTHMSYLLFETHCHLYSSTPNSKHVSITSTTNNFFLTSLVKLRSFMAITLGFYEACSLSHRTENVRLALGVVLL